MGVDDFFDSDDEFLDFELDDFEDFEKSESFFSRLAGLFSKIDQKIYIGILSIVVIIFGLYFLNFENIIQANTEDNQEVNQEVENEIISSSPTSTSKFSDTTLFVKNIDIGFEPYKATVLILLPECEKWGSGTFISNLGYILTNEHVISNDGNNCNENIIILGTTSPEIDLVPLYYAKIAEESYNLDLAILEVVESFDNKPLPVNFYSSCASKTDSVQLSDQLVVWGYPDVRVVNLESFPRIDVSQAFVSGFDPQTGVSERHG